MLTDPYIYQPDTIQGPGLGLGLKSNVTARLAGMAAYLVATGDAVAARLGRGLMSVWE